MLPSERGIHVYSFYRDGSFHTVLTSSELGFPNGYESESQWSDDYLRSGIIPNGHDFMFGVQTKYGKQLLEWIRRNRQGELVALWDMTAVGVNHNAYRETVIQPTSSSIAVSSHYVDPESDRLKTWNESKMSLTIYDDDYLEIDTEASKLEYMQLFFETAAIIKAYTKFKQSSCNEQQKQPHSLVDAFPSNEHDLVVFKQMSTILCQMV